MTLLSIEEQVDQIQIDRKIKGISLEISEGGFLDLISDINECKAPGDRFISKKEKISFLRSTIQYMKFSTKGGVLVTLNIEE